MEVTLSVAITDLRLLKPENSLFGIAVMPVPRTISSSFSQPANTPVNAVTPLGIVTDLSPEALNALVPNEVNVFGRSIASNDVQFWKANAPILVVAGAKVTFARDEQPF